MARFIMRVWVCLALLVGLASLFGVGDAPVSAQGRTRAHQALTRAIEFARGGEYEHALNFFEQAKAGLEDLNPTEQRELQTEMARVQAALKARQEGAAQLLQAEQALQANRTQEALALLKELSGNQHLKPDDKKKVQQLSEQIQPGLNAAARTGAATSQNLLLARGKLRQARTFLGKEDYAAAEALAREAQALNAPFAPGEDTPIKVMEEVAKAKAAKMSSKELLAAARTALERGNLEQAERLAQDAKKNESFWTVRLWGDSPTKVLKDVQAARARQVAKANLNTPAGQSKELLPKGPDKVKAEEIANAASPKLIAPPKLDAPQKLDQPSATTGNATEEARALVRQGRKALSDGQADEALELGRRAAKLNGSFHWWDVDNPSKLMADAHKARAAQPSKTVTAPGVVQAKVEPGKIDPTKIDATKIDPAKVNLAKGDPAKEHIQAKDEQYAKDDEPVDPAPWAAKGDPRAMLKQARLLYNDGKLEEASALCQKVQAARVTWGLFEDTPSKLMSDISKMQSKRDKDESVKLLAEARRLYEAGKLDDADQLTYRAERLHGSYSVWDFGDRPNKLRAEIDAARAKARKIEVPPIPEAVAKSKDDRPGVAIVTDRVTGAPAVIAPHPQTGAPALVTPREQPAPVPAVAANREVAPTVGKLPQTATSNHQQEMARVPGAPSPLAGNTSPISGGNPTSLPTASQNSLPAPSRTELVANPEKQRASQLMADARKDLDQGRLIEARQKALAAQKLGASLSQDEERPERLLLELSAQCNRKVDSLVQQAADLAAIGRNDPAKLHKAEQDLATARQLAVAFGQDTQTIDSKVAWLKTLQGVAVAPMPAVLPPTVAPPVPPPPPVAANPPQAISVPPVASVQHQESTRGQELLDRARLELKKGELTIARRLAEEAFTGPYGVGADARAVLATLDAEEENQRILAANRLFDQVQAAVRQKDYNRARTLVKGIDVARLSVENKTRHRDLMQSSYMQDSQAAAPAAPAGSGVASYTDSAAPKAASGSLQKEFQERQEIMLQRMRTESVKVRNEATRVFNTAPQKAVDMLQTFKGELETCGLEPDYVALLKRQVDSQLQQFQTIKAQVEFKNLQNQQASSAMNKIKHDQLAETAKNEQVAKLLRDYNEFHKKGQYKEAYVMAMKAREVDPDNPYVTLALNQSRILQNQAMADRAKDNQQQHVIRDLNEDPGPAVTTQDPMHFDRERWPIVKNRSRQDAIDSSRQGDKERRIDERLNQPIPSIEFREATPLTQVVEDLRALSGLNIVIDTAALQHEGIDAKQLLSCEPLEGIALKSVMNIILSKITPTRLTWIVQDEVLKITTEREARGKLKAVTYKVADIIIPIDNYIVPPISTLMHQMGRGSSSGVQMGGGPYQGPNALMNGQPAGLSSGGTSPGSMLEEKPATGNPTAGTRAPGQTSTMEEMLIKLITNTISTNTWASAGGPGTLEYFPLGQALVINQTPDVHQQIADLLNALRRLQDLQVSVEVRMISLEEAFFERIGLDFDINLDPKVPPAAQSQIVTQQFAPINQVNYPRFQSVIAGLQPAGSGGATQGINGLTSDLHVPINSSSFGLAIPPFGGFPGIPGANGGLSMGLAFLSDIQVFMFMEAAQGNRRTNVMQAPKLTLFNGQTATIQVQDFQWFVTNVQVVQASGQVVFVPQNQPIPLGVNLAVQAVVSADRRFVRLNLSPTLTNLASATVPLFPITTFITPVFEGGAQGQPVPFTQFIQQPTFTLVTIQTTVSVPDGGTVLLGGLKLMNEGRNEFGPPILSKIPYLNRLWKNVGYGRDTSSLLIMVTPRVIINEEEEEIATGVNIEALRSGR